jgi:uncharacterized membrane protein
MDLEKYGMMGAGIAALVAGLLFVWPRLRAASGADRVVVLGPVFEAVALAVFAAEHFTAAGDLMSIVPRWLPGPLFWTYFVGAAWLAAAISFIVWRLVHWSAPLVALLFLVIVATIDLPNLPSHIGERLFWTLTVRELAFAGGAMVLAGSVWSRRSLASNTLIRLGRGIVAATLVFYGIQHFLFPLFAPGVPLEKLARNGCCSRRDLHLSSESFWCSLESGFLSVQLFESRPPLQGLCFCCSRHSYMFRFSRWRSTRSSPLNDSTMFSTRCYSRRPLCWQASAQTGQYSEEGDSGELHNKMVESSPLR